MAGLSTYATACTGAAGAGFVASLGPDSTLADRGGEVCRTYHLSASVELGCVLTCWRAATVSSRRFVANGQLKSRRCDQVCLTRCPAQTRTRRLTPSGGTASFAPTGVSCPSGVGQVVPAQTVTAELDATPGGPRWSQARHWSSRHRGREDALAKVSCQRSGITNR